MYIPEDLLFKSGQLARVWLAANQHKKLTKAQVLQDKIDEDIEVIMRPDEHAGGPFALRLNGQLLFGVVRIYSRKARYLLDDCNDALWKIKMAFRPGNIDLPAQTHVANPMSLTLPDVITDLDLLAPMPDPELLFSQNHLDLNLALDDTTVPDWDNSQFLSGSIEQPHGELILDDDDLNLDMGDDLGPPPLEFDEGTSIEVGREAPLERRASEEFGTEMKDDLIEDDLNLDMGDDMTDLPGLGPELDLGDDTDIVMGGTELGLPPIEPSVVDEAAPHRGESPLSDIANEELDQLQHTVEGNTAFEPETEQPEEEEESTRQARQKRRKLIAQDTDTTISSSQLREQQANRDKILKPATFLPRDPLLMALINMQRSGGFVSSILGDGRSQGWAPELRGILSLEVVSRPSQKRKRDSGVADLGTEEDEGGAEKTPQLEFDQDEPSLGADIGMGGDTTLGGDSEIIQLPDDGVQQIYDDEDEGFTTLPDNFDDTVAPLVHPAESGPISIGTKHAVQFLRERFGAEAEHSESERQKNSVVFQEMFPESRTTKAEATKMFFEMLVLATKDAIKVEQPINELGGPIRVRAKRGLWGAWAETSASGELASQSEPAPEAPAPEIPAEVSVQA